MISVRRPSPALVISCVALAFALGGTSFAAVSALPKNSVGTPQLKASAVTSAKVKNRSLLRADFGTRQLPPGLPADRPCRAGGVSRASGPERASSGSIHDVRLEHSLTSKTQATTCPTGKRLLGGGCAAQSRFSPNSPSSKHSRTTTTSSVPDRP